MAYQPSSNDQATIRSLDAAVYRMVMAIVSKHASIAQPYPETLSFQILWNASKATIDRVLHGLGLDKQGLAWFRLKEDGLYGPNTGKALSFVTGVATPKKTAGIPAWYLKNKKIIDSYARTLPQVTKAKPASTVAAAKAPITKSPATTVAAQSQKVATAAKSGATTKQNVPAQYALKTSSGTVITQKSPATVVMDDWDVKVGTAKISSYPTSSKKVISQTATKAPTQLASKAKAASDIAKMTSDVSFAPETVPAVAPRSNLVVFAVGAGLIAAAGVFGYMVTQRGHHRRMAA